VRLAAGFGIALSIGAAYILPLASTKQFMITTGVAWESASQLGAQFLRLEGVAGMWPFVLAFGLLGTISGLFSSNFLRRFSAIVVVVLFAFAAGDVLAELHLDALFPDLYSTQLERFLILLKPFLFVLAADAAVSTVRAAIVAGRKLSPQKLAWATASTAIVAFVVTTLVAPFMMTMAGEYVKPLGGLEAASARSSTRDELLRWAKTTLPRQGFFRIGVDVQGHGPVDFGAQLPWPTYKLGGAPVALFKYRMIGRSERLLEALNVRYLVADHEYTSAGFRRIHSVGPYRVYELASYRADPFVIDGTGSVKVERFDREHIVLQASPDARGVLRLNVSYFPRWHATRNGRVVPIETQPLRGEAYTGFMAVPLAPGRYEFVFRASVLDHVATALGMLGLILAALVWALELRVPRITTIKRRIDRGCAWLSLRLRPVGRGLAAASLVVIVALMPLLAAWTPPLRDAGRQMHEERVVHDLFDGLFGASVTLENLRCRRTPDRFDCGETEVVARLAAIDDYGMRKCVLANRVSGSLALRYPDQPRASKLVGFVALPFRARGSAMLTIRNAGAIVHTARAEKNGPPTSFHVPLVGGARDLELALTGASSICFNAQLTSP
jgi:hypothetical protein